MKRFSWQILLGLSLIVLSIIFYLLHYAIFRDPHHIFLYLIGDIAFVFIEVLLVTLIIHQVLSMREKRARLEKLNMVIGAFFSEVGTRLVAYFSDFDPTLDKIRKELVVTNDWSEQEFSSVSKRLRNYDYGVEVQKVELEDLANFLMGKRDFLLRLLENPTLLEHESFTELLRAVFHLAEELANREDLRQVPATDYEHLAGDMKRAYILLVHQWLDYMRHLKDNYPYLFSLAMRANPFDQDASPIVR
jgi:plasmid maintenance system killer protein